MSSSLIKSMKIMFEIPTLAISRKQTQTIKIIMEEICTLKVCRIRIMDKKNNQRPGIHPAAGNEDQSA